MSKETKKNVEICKRFIAYRIQNSINMPIVLFSLMLKIDVYLGSTKFNHAVASEIMQMMNELMPHRKYINPVDLFACLMVCATFAAPYKELSEGYFTDEMTDVLGEFVKDKYIEYMSYIVEFYESN